MAGATGPTGPGPTGTGPTETGLPRFEGAEPDPTPSAPVLRVISAHATPEEVAALVAVLSALGHGAPPPAPRRTPEWSRPARRHRPPLSHGPGGWRSSALPR